MDLDKAIGLVKPLIEGCNFDDVAVTTSEDQLESEEGKELPVSYDVVVRDKLFTRSQMERLNSLIEKSPEFHNISYQLWRTEHLLLYEVEEEAT